MIKHVVMLKFMAFAEGNAKSDNIRIFAEMLNTLPEKIDVIKSYSVGINQLESPRAVDLCLISEFESWDALNEYSVNPEHLQAVQFMKKVCEVSHTCDYEFKK